MAAVNGTSVLVTLADYDGSPIAMQRGLSLDVECDLPDGSSKDSNAWAEHFAGLLNIKINFNALFGVGTFADETPQVSASDLFSVLTGGYSFWVTITGIGNGYSAEVDMSSLSFEAPMEGAMTLSGSLKIKGVLAEIED